MFLLRKWPMKFFFKNNRLLFSKYVETFMPYLGMQLNKTIQHERYSNYINNITYPNLDRHKTILLCCQEKKG